MPMTPEQLPAIIGESKMLLRLEAKRLHHILQGVTETLTIAIGERSVVALDEVGGQVVTNRTDGPGLYDDLVEAALGDLGSKPYERMAFEHGFTIVGQIYDDVTKLVVPCREKMSLWHIDVPFIICRDNAQ